MGTVSKLELPNAECPSLTGRWLKADRVILRGKVFYSEAYKRMQRRVCHAEVIDESVRDDSDTFTYGLVKYVIYSEKECETFAVVEVVQLGKTPTCLEKVVKHFTWIDRTRLVLGWPYLNSKMM